MPQSYFRISVRHDRMVAVGAAGDRSNWQAAISGILCSNRVRNHSGRTAEYWVRFRQACVMVRFIPSVESRSLSTVFGQQGIHIVADTVPEVVADGTNLVEPGDQGIAVAGR